MVIVLPWKCSRNIIDKNHERNWPLVPTEGNLCFIVYSISATVGLKERRIKSGGGIQTWRGKSHVEKKKRRERGEIKRKVWKIRNLGRCQKTEVLNVTSDNHKALGSGDHKTTFWLERGQQFPTSDTDFQSQETLLRALRDCWPKGRFSIGRSWALITSDQVSTTEAEEIKASGRATGQLPSGETLRA